MGLQPLLVAAFRHISSLWGYNGGPPMGEALESQGAFLVGGDRQRAAKGQCILAMWIPGLMLSPCYA